MENIQEVKIGLTSIKIQVDTEARIFKGSWYLNSQTQTIHRNKCSDRANIKANFPYLQLIKASSMKLDNTFLLN